MRNWLDVVAELLSRAGLESEIVKSTGRLSLVRWALSGEWRRFDAVHHVGGPCNWRTSLILGLIRRPTIWHWIGSDYLGFRDWASHGLQGIINRRAAYRWASAHLSDSPELAEELKAVGLRSCVVRLLPKQIEAEVEPLPEKFTVLSYWSDGRFNFYQGEIVLQLAAEFPDVPFRVVGARGVGVSAPDNVSFLGFQEDMTGIYRDSTVLIRTPEHDSLSAMVLEMLARGRYVIYNRPLDYCHFARDLAEARKALLEIRERREPNVRGAQFVRERFSLDAEGTVLSEIYAVIGGKR